MHLAQRYSMGALDSMIRVGQKVLVFYFISSKTFMK